MNPRSWIRKLFARSPRTARKEPGRSRPRLEALEDRTLPASFNALTVTDLIADIKQSNSTSGTNTINLTAPSSSPYTVTAVDNTTDGPTGLPVIAANNSLIIVGNGDTIQRSTATGTPAFRLFDVAAGATLNLQNLTVQNGLASGSGVQAKGGAIYSQGRLSLDTVTIQNSTALGSDGAVGNPGSPGQAASGGAIYVAAGSLMLTNSTLSGDAALGGAGGAGAAGGVGGAGGAGGLGAGGGIYLLAGNVALSNDALTGNIASGGNGGDRGSGAFGGGTGGNGADGSGGGLFVAAGTVTLSNDTLSGDTASGSLGGGTGGSSASDFAGSPGFAFGGALNFAQGTATLTNDTLSGNSALGIGSLAFGGGLFVSAASVEVDSSNFSHDTANGGVGAGPIYPPPGDTLVVPDTAGNSYGGGIFINGTGGSVTLNSSTLANNSAQGVNVTTSAGIQYTTNWGIGGGLADFGGLATLTNCIVSGNSAGISTGGVALSPAFNGSVDIAATATLSDCTISDNSAPTGGGLSTGGEFGAESTLTMTGCTITGNSATGEGGGLFFGVLCKETLSNCTISGNSAGDPGGGGLANANASTLTLTGCTINGNSTTGSGGGLWIQGTATLTGCTISGNSAGVAGGGLNNIGTATLSDCTISGNSAADGNGGGLEDSDSGMATLTDCTISGNSATCTIPLEAGPVGEGGGLSVDGSEGINNHFPTALTLTDCTISGNSATQSTSFGGGSGGGLFVGNTETATLMSCTINGNSANDGGGLFVDGGGIFAADTAGNGTATLINCTVSSNSAGNGGGVFLAMGDVNGPGGPGATATLTNCTVSGNSAASGGGLYFAPGLFNGGTADLNNTIVAAQTSGGDVSRVDGGSLTGNNNLIGDGSGGISGTGNLLNVDPKLAPLGNYGGPTQTMALLLGSPAIDAGSSALAVDAQGHPLQADQRGYQRVDGPNVDIGAYEVNAADRSVVTVSSPSVTYGGTATVTLQAEDELGHNLTSGGLTVSFALGAGTSGGTLSAVTDHGNGTYTATFTATAAGTAHTLTATITGLAVTTTLPTVTVTPATPTLTASAGSLGVAGVPLTASATLAGSVGETGTITFTLYAPNGNAVDTETATVSGNGTYTTPHGFLASVGGTYQWVASYGGDGNNQSVSTTQGSTPEMVVGPGATVVGSSLYLVGGNTNDSVTLSTTGASKTGSSGIKVTAHLNGVNLHTVIYTQAFTTVYFFGFGGSDQILMSSTLTIATVVSEGGGKDIVHLGNGNNVVVGGNGSDQISAGNGNNHITLGNGHNTVTLGNGTNVVVGGTGTNVIHAGNGNNLLVGGLGHDSLTAGNGSNILIDGSVQLSHSSDSLDQVLSDWVRAGSSAANIAAIRSRLQVTDNAINKNTLHAGKGLDWFWATFAQDHLNRKATDLLN